MNDINYINRNKNDIENYSNSKSDIDNDEKELQESLKRVEQLQGKNIIWKSSREILGVPKVVILPNKIDYSNFNQGNIGDCYFITCVNALSQIPQLLNFIMGLTSKEVENEVNNDIFIAKFYIDGIWETITVKDSFPVFNVNLPNKNALVGVKPKENELFMMILEKAWAKINGGYDRIFGGRIMKIYELFLGCTCNYLDKDNDQNLFEEIRKNENNFGTLSLCSAPYLTKAVNVSGKKTYHAYTIIKTLEIYPKNNKKICQTCQFLILSNPHGKNSSKKSVSIEEINEIIEKKFGLIIKININIL